MFTLGLVTYITLIYLFKEGNLFVLFGMLKFPKPQASLLYFLYRWKALDK
jgi:hypothetical protein